MDELFSIVTLTLNPTLDISSAVPHVTPDDKLRCDLPSAEPGGGGINVSRVCERFGEHTAAILAAGGTTGSRIQQLLAVEGLQAVPVTVDAESRQAISITEKSSGRQFRFVLPGRALTAEEVLKCHTTVIEAAAKARFLVISGSMPEGVDDSFIPEIIDALPDTRVIVDTSGSALTSALQSPAELVKPSARELGRQLGRSLDTESDVADAATELFERSTVGCILASIGSGGAILVDQDGLTRLRAPTVRVRSTVGAGDSMVAGVTVGLSRGLSRVEAASLGVATGTAAVLTEGTGLALLADVERLHPEVNVERRQG